MAARIEGLARLRRKLTRLPRETDLEIRAAMMKGADEIVALMKSRVAVDEGELRDSIGWTWGAAPKGAIKTDSVGSGRLAITIYAGSQDVFWARWVEFGTSRGAPAQPYFYNSYHALKKRAKARIARAVRKATKRVAQGG